ncbi:hypothetical protein EVAR_87266_1 [Eumeta japonica]|uniref:CHK kinase-like domain-containing protein n=1 Tax=Eumeta variegata TaxID=151549 RepID=A0A4C1VYH6_EUMVA|nr:hypothetical protein EVAR_87266_1 [Eumeta japonica]
MLNNELDVASKELGIKTNDAVENGIVLFAEVADLIIKIIKDYNFKHYTINKSSIMIQGEGAMGRLYRVNVKEVDEIFVYEELSKVYESLQIEAGVPLEDRYDFVKCFGVCKNEGSEALILENMTAKGTKVEPLATQYQFDDNWTRYVWNTARATLDVFEPTDPRHQKIRDFVDKTIQKFPVYFARADRSVLCHGDYRPSNILKKEEDGILSGVLPVDYQIVQMCSPVIDLAYFFFAGADRAFRSAHMTDLIHLYRETMRTFLARFGVDLEGVSPTPEFEREYRDKLDYGLMIGIVFLPFILVSPEHAPDLSSTPFTELRIRGSPVFRQRMTEIVDDFVSWGQTAYIGPRVYSPRSAPGHMINRLCRSGAHEAKSGFTRA